MVTNKTLSKDLMSTQRQWNILEHIEECLRTMAKFQQIIMGDKYVIRSFVVISIHKIQAAHKRLIDSQNTKGQVIELAEKLLQDFNIRIQPGEDGKVCYTGQTDIHFGNKFTAVHT